MPHKTPLIVCGFGRSGTRMVADILNRDGRCCLQGEIPHAIAIPMIKYMKTLSKYYRRSKVADSFTDKAHEPFERIFESATQSPVIRRKRALYFGHKTPKHERYFRAYEVSLSHLQPRYIYCHRNPQDVWRSYRNMKWSNYADVHSFIADWRASQESYQKIRDVAPNRVYKFDLDQYKTARSEVITEMFQFLQLQVRPEQAAVLADLPNRNSSVAKMGRPTNPVPDAEVAAIDSLLSCTS